MVFYHTPKVRYRGNERRTRLYAVRYPICHACAYALDGVT